MLPVMKLRAISGAALLEAKEIFKQAQSALSDALKNVGGDREKVRAYVTDPTHVYDTVLGKFSFDKNGDTTQRIISDYTFDPGTKDWKFVSQKDFGAG